MRTIIHLLILVSFISIQIYSQEIMNSDETEDCLMCHVEIHPGIVESWQKSLHAKVTPLEALKKNELNKRMSSLEIDSVLASTSVGCYECHSLNLDKHSDSFEHNGYQINIIVSSNDCSACHIDESDQYSKNIMSHAYNNLVSNDVYNDLIKSVNANYHYNQGAIKAGEVDSLTMFESCLYCHGTELKVSGLEARDTEFGEMEFPVLEGWPNQGVGRINTDGSKGACTSCHPRHDFSIETARKPYTCSECHKGPDVPAYKVYAASKHGNNFSSKKDEFNFNNVPWVIGEDFTSPTCASCHVSLLVDTSENVIAERTHQFNDRLANRLFGVPYSHPHPVSPDLSNVKNSQGLPLIVELDGTPVKEFVIDENEQMLRNENMKAICNTCHSQQWTDNHFVRLDNTIKQTNDITLQATNVLVDIWKSVKVKGLPQGESIFDDEAERIWTNIWLFHTNSTRFASAMAGGGDYGVFADGRYQTTEQLIKLVTKLKELKNDQ
jgi:hydroxylamine dehydrogenase